MCGGDGVTGLPEGAPCFLPTPMGAMGGNKRHAELREVVYRNSPGQRMGGAKGRGASRGWGRH